jgi:hypothetical protein
MKNQNILCHVLRANPEGVSSLRRHGMLTIKGYPAAVQV